MVWERKESQMLQGGGSPGHQEREREKDEHIKPLTGKNERG